VTTLDETWRKSLRSAANGACVEVRQFAGAVQVRDSKDQAGPALSFPAESWRWFVSGVHAGEFDRVEVTA